MDELKKPHGNVRFGQNGWNDLHQRIEQTDPSSIVVLCDSNTKQDCLPLLQKKLKLSTPLSVLEIPAGESHKQISTCLSAWTELTDRGVDRAALVLNLGGGVVTDLGGFVASTFKRGIRFVNIPTSLLAMVDASIGGKNGVDLGALKNQVGVICEPELVLIDPEFLRTLPEVEFRSGKAEMIKHGLIQDPEYFDRVLGLMPGDTQEAMELIAGSVTIKQDIVRQDQNEQGIRKSLNYGHTLGHAIESYCLSHDHMPDLLHGEAIAIGMILESHLSSTLLGFPQNELQRVVDGLFVQYPKVAFTEKDIEQIAELMKYDKKNRGGRIRFVLLERIGKASLDHEAPKQAIGKAFEFYTNLI